MTNMENDKVSWVDNLYRKKNYVSRRFQVRLFLLISEGGTSKNIEDESTHNGVLHIPGAGQMIVRTSAL